jgi:hypothetical protein
MPNKARIMLLLAGAVFASLTAAALTFSSNGRSAPPSGTVSVLNGAAAASDKLPAGFSNSPAATHLQAATARLAQVSIGESIFVSRGASSSSVCLLVSGNAYFGTCAARQTLISGAIYITTPASDGTMSVYAVVPDGYTTATVGGVSVGVARNSAVLRGVPQSSLLTLSGPAGTRNVDLGNQEPGA